VVAALPEIRPDLLVADFPAIHLAGHQLWDPASVVDGISAASARELKEALCETIVEVDKALGRIVDALPADADIVVFSPLGMDTDTSRSDVLGVVLAAVLDNASLAGASMDGSWRFRAAVPTSVRAHVARALPDRVAIELAARLELRRIDWSRTRAFVVPSDTSGLIRFNVRDRERDGIVAPVDVAALAAEIRAALGSFAFEDGSPVVASVDVVADTFGGGVGSHLLPDLVVRWSDRPARRGEVLHSPQYGSLHRDSHGSGRSGNHTADAWALVVPGSGRVTQRALGDVGDIAATALARFGLESAGESLIEPM
jgi:predicted AlkP superfamily phosphohydrolase/phosphomutase